MGCKIGANAIRLHDEVLMLMIMMVAKLFRTLHVDAIVEPTRLFTDAAEDAGNQRPDVFLRNIPAAFSHAGQTHDEFKASAYAIRSSLPSAFAPSIAPSSTAPFRRCVIRISFSLSLSVAFVTLLVK